MYNFPVDLANLKSSNAEVIFLNSNGAIVARQAVKTGTQGQIINFNLVKLPAGIYLVKVMSEDGVQTKEITIQR